MNANGFTGASLGMYTYCVNAARLRNPSHGFGLIPRAGPFASLGDRRLRLSRWSGPRFPRAGGTLFPAGTNFDSPLLNPRAGRPMPPSVPPSGAGSFEPSIPLRVDGRPSSGSPRSIGRGLSFCSAGEPPQQEICAADERRPGQHAPHRRRLGNSIVRWFFIGGHRRPLPLGEGTLSKRLKDVQCFDLFRRRSESREM
jgi:hypothetical protein